MKKYTLLFLLLSRLVTAEPLEFAGFLSSREQGALVVLADKGDNTTSPWLSVGKEWRGYRVIKVDAVQNTVVVTKADKVLTLHLRESRVQDGGTDSSQGMRLIRGQASRMGERVTYTPDAILQIGTYRISARAGSMMSEGAWIVGDLTIQDAGGATLPAASVGVNAGKIRISAKRISLPSPPPDFESAKK